MILHIRRTNLRLKIRIVHTKRILLSIILGRVDKASLGEKSLTSLCHILLHMQKNGSDKDVIIETVLKGKGPLKHT